jgi:hypothetical protein
MPKRLFIYRAGIRLVGTDGWSWLRRSRSRVVGAGDWRRQSELRRPSRQGRDWLLALGKTAKPGDVAGRRLRNRLLPRRGASRLGRLDARRHDSAGVTPRKHVSLAQTARGGNSTTRRMVPFWGGSRRTLLAAAPSRSPTDRSMSGLASIPSHLFDVGRVPT